MVLAPWLASCPAAAVAATSLVGTAPPWSLESPAAAGKRFSLGLELVFERQESLRITAFDQLVEVVDLLSGEQQTSRLPGDPELLNRKFDLVFERASVSPSFALALPSADLIVGQLYPTLTVSAAAGDVTLDFDDRTEPRDSTSLRGRGALFETRLDLVATLCRSCPWFTATTYRFEKLPTLAVDRSPRFTLAGFTVPRDEVRLAREVQEVSSRVGYTAPGGRTASFVGVQHRWTDVAIDDRLAYRDALTETGLSSRTKLESQTTLAVAGVDVALGGGFFARLETAVGDGDSVVSWSVSYLLSTPTDRGGERASQIAKAIAPLLADILERFRGERARLATRVVDGVPVYSRAEVQGLLERFEREVLAALDFPELAALRDHVERRFLSARLAIDAVPAAGPPSSPRPARLVRTVALAAGSRAATVAQAAAEGPLDDIERLIANLWRFATDDDLRVVLCVRSAPVIGADFAVFRQGASRPQEQTRTNWRLPPLYRGDWEYRLTRSGHKQVAAAKLNLVDSAENVLDCTLVAQSSAEEPGWCRRRAGDVEKECPTR